MSTPNFHNVNASKIYAVEIDDPEDQYQYKDLLENLKYELDGIGPSKEATYNALRSYPATAICELYKNKQYKNFEVTAAITPVIRSGYYSGVNLDYELTEDVSAYDLTPREQELADRWIKRTHAKMAARVEKIFKRYSTSLICRAVFSNGEAVYAKA
mgnify:CR=1 FL=1